MFSFEEKKMIAAKVEELDEAIKTPTGEKSQ